MRVLVVDGSAGQSHGALGAVRALAAAGHEVDVAHASRWALAARSRHATRRLAIPGTEDPGFPEAVRRLLDGGGYAACFPTSDAALVALDWPGAGLVDKRLLRTLCETADVLHPRSQELDSGADLLQRAGELRYPVAVKAAAKVGAGSTSAARADSPADLELLAGLAELTDAVVVEEWLTGEQQAVSGVVHDGRLLAVAHQRYVRTWPVCCGIACAAVTTEPDRALEERLVAMLDGYDGIFQAQLIDSRLHDVNPRVFGSVLLAASAGANLPDVAARLAAGEASTGEPVRARPGVPYRWVEGDVRHLLATLRSGESSRLDVARALRPVRGTVHPDVWWSDPRPTLARLVYAVRRRGAS
jgi:predicted ATP-grasp superfamily ATP-dependent carboligase